MVLEIGVRWPDRANEAAQRIISLVTDLKEASARQEKDAKNHQETANELEKLRPVSKR